MHCNKYIQSSSPNIIPKSISLHFVLSHFLHLKSCPEESFSAAPFPICCFVIFSVIMVDSVLVCGSWVWHFLQIMYCLESFVIVISMFLQVGQNWIVILFCWIWCF